MTAQPDRWAVWAFGADRPGIVAAVTGVLVDRGHNLLDCSMTLLGGHFAMMLFVDAQTNDDQTSDDLERALGERGTPLGLTVTVRAVAPSVDAGPRGEPWIVSVYGSDRPGIVHRVSALLADREVNVTDLTTRVIGDPSTPVYAMLIEAELPADLDPEALAAELADLGRELGVETSLQPVDADVL